MSESVKNMILHKTQLNKDIINLQKVINAKKKSIKILEKELWKKCQHCWKIINDDDDLCSKECIYCGLYRLSSLYH